MTWLEQRGAVAFVFLTFIALVNTVCGCCRSRRAAARLLGQPKFLHLRADFVHVPAKEACGLCNRPAVVEFVLGSLTSTSDQGSPKFASVVRYSLDVSRLPC
jgi:hypothetical protein